MRAKAKQRSLKTPSPAQRTKSLGSPPAPAIRSILVPIDFSEPATEALTYAIAFAQQFSARISLVYVVEPVAYPDFAAFPLTISDQALAEAATAKLDQMANRYAKKDDFFERIVVRKGVPFKEITTAAAEFKTDLIIISTHGRTGLAHVMLGSTTERVVRHAGCPVLVVRKKERGFV